MIVKNLLAVGAIAGLATAASAADASKANWTVKGKIRMDAKQQSETTKEGTAEATTAKSSEIILKRAQFHLVGEQNGDTMNIKYYAEGNELNTATITHKFTDMVSATFGKMDVLAQSWENDYSSTDQYLLSWANGFVPGSQNGAQIDANFGDHSVAVQITQGLTVDTRGTDATADDLAFASKGGLNAALQYRGEINKMIRPLVTYTVIKPAGSKTAAGDNYSNGLYTMMGLGVQADVAGLVADLEFDTVKLHKKKLEPAVDTNKDSDVQSIVVQAKYAIGATTPFVKLASNSHKFGQQNGIGDKTGMGFAVGVEHKLDASCRLHAVYTSDASSTKTSTDTKTKVDTTGFNLGVTAWM